MIVFQSLRPTLTLDFIQRYAPETAVAVYVAVNLWAMELWKGWETLPFHFIYFGFAIMYGVRSWRVGPTLGALVLVALSTFLLTFRATARGSEDWAELAEVPLMAVLCLAMVFHVERRRRAVDLSRRLADERAAGIELERRFFSRASHELLTPITIARGHLELLGRGGPPLADEVTVARDVTLDELARMQSLVGELLLVAKLASGAMEREEIPVAELVRGAAQRWLSLPQRSWTLRIDATGTIEGSPGAIGRALESLIENAFRHTAPGQTIAISALPRPDGVALVVADDGRGIPADELPRVFERFYRGSHGSPGGGAGLGLSIVKAVAEAHGGGVQIESIPGRGTRIEIDLPRRIPAQTVEPVVDGGPSTGPRPDARPPSSALPPRSLAGA